MRINICFIVLLFPLLCLVPALDCPYQGQALPLANSLSGCFNVPSTLVSFDSLVHCIANFTGDTTSVYTSQMMREITKHALLRKEDYKQCSENFNNLLQVIYDYQVTDSASPGKPKPENITSKIWKLVNDGLAYQDYYCNTIEEQYDESINRLLKKTQVNVINTRFDIYVYERGDIVSNSILQQGSWEISEARQIIYGLETYRRTREIDDPREVMFLDIGGQIGWFTLLIGNRGYKVFVFEPMQINQYIIRHNICSNRSMDITYVNKGLDKEDKVCHLYSASSNAGNAELYCDNSNKPRNLINRGAIELMQLDEFAPFFKNLAVIKMDIEGNEYNTVKGGRSVLLNMHVPYIVTEFSPKMMRDKGADPVEYVQEFISAGYKVDSAGFTGKKEITLDYIKKKSNITDREYRTLNINLYFIYVGH